MMPASDPSGKLWDNFAAQMKQVMDNLTAVLKSAGTDWSRVIKTNVMLVRPNDFAQMNRIYGSYFAEGKYSGRTTVIVGELPSESLLEIECEAALE